jgi:transcriptional regulator with GAF, ATPase, and Fis domain
VFLDEIGELDAQIQVKLLRVLQNREFQRVGDSETRRFVGKIIAATNRDLAAEMEAGRFREDFYYRLCADRIETPPLRMQLRDSCEDLANFVRFIAGRLLPELPDEVARLADEVVSWVDENLGPNYAWPGNIRELEQCVRSIMIRGSYTPTRRPSPTEKSPLREFLAQIEGGELDRDELLRGYFSLMYARSGSYRAAGRQLRVDWRTVKDLVDDNLARKFAESGSE